MAFYERSKQLIKSRLQKYENYIVIGIGILIALFLRRSLLYYQTIDFRAALNSWYNFIVEHRGIEALKYDFANYTPPYLYLLVIATYIFSGFPTIVAIKIVSIVFDFLCAFFTYKLVRLKYPKGNLPIIAFLCILFAPTVFLNSSYWGQADAIYTSGLLACLYFLCINKKLLSFICFGIAYSFKQQAMFLAPFLIFMCFKRVASWKLFILIPAVYVITIIPAWLVGRPFKELLLIFFNQTTTFRSLTMNAPSLYAWIPNKFYNIFVPLGLLLTLAVIAWLSSMIYRSRIEITRPLTLQLALVSVLVTPYFLPKMHERYFFAADIISIIFGFYFPSYFFIPVSIGLVSLFSYFPFMLGEHLVSLKVLSSILAVTISIVIYHLYQTLYPDKKQS